MTYDKDHLILNNTGPHIGRQNEASTGTTSGHSRPLEDTTLKENEYLILSP